MGLYLGEWLVELFESMQRKDKREFLQLPQSSTTSWNRRRYEKRSVLYDLE